jgi:hypothetical protein
MTGQPASTKALWTHLVQHDHFGPKPFDMKLAATASERVAIAAAYGCLSVEELSARLSLSRKGALLRVVGELQARVTQACVVTLEPVSSAFTEEVMIRFAPPRPDRITRKGPASGEPETVVAMDAEDPPELVVDGMADIGTALLELFALGLNPYPRAPEAVLEQAPVSAPVELDLRRPFAGLAALQAAKAAKAATAAKAAKDTKAAKAAKDN